MNRDLSIIMISLFSEDRRQEIKELKFSNPEKYKRTIERQKLESKEKSIIFLFIKMTQF